MITLTLSAILLAAAMPWAHAASFTISPETSKVRFRVRNLLLNRVHGEFRKFHGAFEYAPANADSWRAEVTIDPASIDTGIRRRDRHLRTEDFLHVSSHSAIRFVSTGAQPKTEGKGFLLLGDLTIRGVTRPVTLDVEPVDTESKTPRFKATARLDRRDFAVGHNAGHRASRLSVGCEVFIQIEIEGHPN